MHSGLANFVDMTTLHRYYADFGMGYLGLDLQIRREDLLLPGPQYKPRISCRGLYLILLALAAIANGDKRAALYCWNILNTV